jgi:hypothetical protein
MASRHSLGSDIRRYRLTLSEARDASWRSIRYIRPQQKLKEVTFLFVNPLFFQLHKFLSQRFHNGHV